MPVPFFVRLAAVLVLALAAPRAGVAQEGPAVGDPAPGFAAADLDGRVLDLDSLYGRRPVLLVFWASWCESCKALLPALRTAHEAYGGEVEFIGVNVTIDDPPAAVRQYLASHRPPFRTLYDGEGAGARAYDVAATSAVFIVDREGRVAYSGVGGAQDLTAALGRLERRPGPDSTASEREDSE